jgi:glucose-6-phosphate 1-dehydrogenase
MAEQSPLEKQIAEQTLSDNAIIFRVQTHDFVALTSQSRSVSARFGQQMEKQAVEFDYSESMAARPFDPMSTSFMLQKDRVNNNGITVNEQFLLALLNAKPAA